MKLVVNTNILFSFFNEKSVARELATLAELDLYSPEFSLKELEKHKQEILEKFSLNETQHLLILSLLKTTIKFVNETEYKEELLKAKQITPDPDDIDFFALSLKLNCPIWSNDKKLKNQTEVKILSTKEIIDLT